MLYSGFFDSINHDRKYSSRDFSRIFDGVITDGVFMSVGDRFNVIPGTGLAVVVGSGRSWFHSTWAYNDGGVIVSIDSPPLVGSRIDAIVLRIKTAQEFRYSEFAVIKGTASESSPVKPTLTNTDDLHEIALAYVTVVHGASSISAANIENVVGTSQTPLVTSILEQTDVDALYANWQAEFEEWEDSTKEDFDEWFQTIQDIMTEDVAANLTSKYVEIESNFAVRDIEISFTLPKTGWNGASAPYYQTVSVSGITDNMKAVFSISESATDAQFASAADAMIAVTSHTENSITVKAFGEKPNVDIPCVILVSKYDIYNGSNLRGVCSTAAGTAAKTVTIAGLSGLIAGAAVIVKFTNGNTANNPTLNVNGTGAKTVIDADSWDAGKSVAFVYDGSKWESIGYADTGLYDVIDGGTW